ncbi:Histone H2B [Penicillium digitatum]|uniref:Histone H2B n=1 Tax=Penicillium digitatum TaxID=36651 RepID=A0A7T7BM24_PENDI|nr:Histone H2B [Penicillium digitatum]
MFQHQSHDPSFLESKAGKDYRFALPGFNRPLDFAPMEKNIYGVESRSIFPSALDDRDIQAGFVDLPVLTLREMRMVEFMEDLTDIPEWWKKVFEPATQEKWKKAAMNSGKDITLNMAEWIIDELQFKAMIYEVTDVVALYNGDVTKSDTNLPKSLYSDMRSQFAALEYDEKSMQYFYPGSLNKERDLISMALYPVVYGKTRILTDRIIGLDDALRYAGKGEVIPVPKETGITREDIAWRVLARADIKVRPYNRNYQILPSDWELGDDGQWHITTYINNVHPVKHRNLYKLLEQAFNCIIPQWNATLTPLKDMLHSRARIEYHKAEYYPVPKEVAAQAPQIHPREAQSEFDVRTEKWRMENYRAIQPDAGKFIPWAVPPWLMDKLPEDLPSAVRIERGVDLNRDYKERGLQVITRLLGVDLTPEDPTFETNWHGDGTMNEHICAVAVIPYDHNNLLDPFMEFRNIVESDTLGEIEHDPSDFIWLQQVFGLTNGEPAIQYPGSICANIGRVIMYPSTIQHKFTRFELKDKTKPGYARTVAFYLVDPNIRIISTANIPPQRLDWTKELSPGEGVKEGLQRLALENMKSKGDMPMSLEEALETRIKLLKEMDEFTRYQHVAFESNVLML